MRMMYPTSPATRDRGQEIIKYIPCMMLTAAKQASEEGLLEQNGQNFR